MENMKIITEPVYYKKDLAHFVNVSTLIMCGLTIFGYVIYMTWTIADYLGDIDKKVAVQQEQISNINQNIQEILNRLDK
jgi:hypothetical protein